MLLDLRIFKHLHWKTTEEEHNCFANTTHFVSPFTFTFREHIDVLISLQLIP